ncbi:MAG: glucose-6-phosphate dehydrogenase [Candidatus Diapherotrites archaeon]|uniref:Glucose-6-phosphate dehydrogenase n=1 Tax=Candidatus Iainarchaeum sp. TaxID=3101447 RepID=A0A8T3YK04_9ARCH|nr:glucose-6-phosphate dehydrogenase [Candidatus Diapherotrites archaeon]
MGKMQNNFSFIILGATGDLAQKKLFPALHGLIRMNRTGNDFCIIGTGRKDFSREEFAGLVKSNIPKLHEDSWKRLEERLYYHAVDFGRPENGFKSLQQYLSTTEKAHNAGENRLFYLATLPSHFKSIAYSLRKHGLTETKGWCRLVFEKPFGSDEKTARELNREIRKVFDEKQIYRIDHYLGKELVQSIGILRAGNRIFSPIWNSENIDHVQINLIEDFGIGNRGNFYDNQGALRDVGQNHLLQLLCLIAMEIPARFDEKCIRNEKVKVLRKVKLSARDAVLGQYEGYSSEPGVGSGSKTETFFALKATIGNKRWKGVPFYLRSGKNLGRKFASIYIQFKEPNYTVFHNQRLNPNYLVIQIQPDDGMLVQLNGKVPGEKLKVMPVKMTFCHECAFGPNTPQAYETLLFEALQGDQSAFVRSDEVELSWKTIDKVTKKRPVLHPYAKGSMGPKEADEMIAKDGREWFNRIENVVQGL